MEPINLSTNIHNRTVQVMDVHLFPKTHQLHPCTPWIAASLEKDTVQPRGCLPHSSAERAASNAGCCVYMPPFKSAGFDLANDFPQQRIAISVWRSLSKGLLRVITSNPVLCWFIDSWTCWCGLPRVLPTACPYSIVQSLKSAQKVSNGEDWEV